MMTFFITPTLCDQLSTSDCSCTGIHQQRSCRNTHWMYRSIMNASQAKITLSITLSRRYEYDRYEAFWERQHLDDQDYSDYCSRGDLQQVLKPNEALLLYVNSNWGSKGNNCHEKCRLKCSSHISNTSRQELFDAFYSLNSSAQDVHLFQCISSRKPKLSLVDASSHRQVTIYYSVVAGGSRLHI